MRLTLKLNDYPITPSPPLPRQTIHHQPVPMKMWGETVTSTLQIGDPSIIANVVGVTTVGDFRLADMSVGGQGAPLVPYLDRSVGAYYYS